MEGFSSISANNSLKSGSSSRHQAGETAVVVSMKFDVKSASVLLFDFGRNNRGFYYQNPALSSMNFIMILVYDHQNSTCLLAFWLFTLWTIRMVVSVFSNELLLDRVNAA
ncbi:MAG: hypothetical protein LBQ66_10690 [Planctomycetaceae bacterium]|nr:hypothetical protein [Planctomycetaceae bacterium]